jgi:hypothetical protein
MLEEGLDTENFSEREGFKYRRPRKRKSVTPMSERVKNKMRYRKNKWKLKLYNRKYREKNKAKLKRQRKLRERLRRV